MSDIPRAQYDLILIVINQNSGWITVDEFQSTPNLGQGSDAQPGALEFLFLDILDLGNNVIDYFNISSTGDAVNFLLLLMEFCCFILHLLEDYIVTSPGSPVASNTIEFITISSTGDGTDFGDTSTGSVIQRASCFQQLVDYLQRWDEFFSIDVIDYVTIESTGNAVDLEI